MKGLVYGGPGERSWTDIPDAHVQNPRDAVIRVDAVTICGTDHMVTHRFALDQIMAAYDVFSRPAETGALKVVLSR